MKKTLCSCIGLSLIVWSIWAAVAQEPAKTTKKVVDAEPNKHEAAIRTSVAQFVKAYNAHDAKAISELFLAEAQIIDEDDNTIQGRVEKVLSAEKLVGRWKASNQGAEFQLDFTKPSQFLFKMIGDDAKIPGLEFKKG